MKKILAACSIVVLLFGISYTDIGDALAKARNSTGTYLFRITRAGAVIHTGSYTQVGNIVLTGSRTQTGMEIDTPTAHAVLSASTAITVTNKYMTITTTGTISSTATPLISTAAASYVDGTRVKLLCTNDSTTFTISDKGTLTNSCLSLGATTRVLGLGDSIVLVKQGGFWREETYTNVQ